MKLITTNTKNKMKKFLRFVDRLATLEVRLQGGSVTVRVADLRKHTTQDVWWVEVETLKTHAGTIAKKIITDDIVEIKRGYQLTIKDVPNLDGYQNTTL